MNNLKVSEGKFEGLSQEVEQKRKIKYRRQKRENQKTIPTSDNRKPENTEQKKQ